jgi:hypothetical protein
MTRRLYAAMLVAALAITTAVTAVRAAPPGPTLVLPLRTVGVSDATALVSRDLLIGSLEDLGVQVMRDTAHAEACDDPECAARIGRERGAGRVVYGSLSQLGGKIIARLDVLRAGEAQPYYRDQLTALTEEDLDQVMRRFAEGIAAGRPNSDRATVETVTQAEAVTPPRRAVRSGFGLRAGFLFPTNGGYADADRLTNFHAAFRYEMPHWQIQSSSLLGFTWGKENFDWAILDVTGARIFGLGDFASYLGVGVGVHSITVTRHQTMYYASPYDSTSYPYDYQAQQTETVPTADLVLGLITMRTYDFQLVLEARYRHVFETFDKVGGNGADGVLVTFGTSR